MGPTLLSAVDVDVVLQWAEMQNIMDELSETEEDSGSSVDDVMSASDVLSTSESSDPSSTPYMPSRLTSLNAEPLLGGGLNGIRPVLDSRHLLNAARADAKMSSHIASLLQTRAAGGALDSDSIGGHEELQSFLPPLLFGSRPFPPPRSNPFGRPSSPFVREDEDDDDLWMLDPSAATGGKPRPGGGDDKGSGKTRFVWSSELHLRFEQAVAKLGVDRAKPQAISQLMGVEGDNAPTRQNIKSHLQKYRLLVKKRAAQAAEAGGGGGGVGGGMVAGMKPGVAVEQRRADGLRAL